MIDRAISSLTDLDISEYTLLADVLPGPSSSLLELNAWKSVVTTADLGFGKELAGLAGVDRAMLLRLGALISGAISATEPVVSVWHDEGRLRLEFEPSGLREYDHLRVTTEQGVSLPVQTGARLVQLGLETSLRRTGAMFVCGNSAELSQYSTPLTFNPFNPPGGRILSIWDRDAIDVIVKFTRLDYAFHIDYSGQVRALFMTIGVPPEDFTDRGSVVGLGSRHATAHSISKVTNSVVVTVQGSTGTVRAFTGGCERLTLRVKGMTDDSSGARPELPLNAQ